MFDFGEALKRLKDGRRVARAGWNGKNMYLFLGMCSPNSIIGNGPGTDMVNPDCLFICLKAADDQLVVGWVASQTDVLKSDWVEVSDDA
jgi:hypothetical protein